MILRIRGGFRHFIGRRSVKWNDRRLFFKEAAFLKTAPGNTLLKLDISEKSGLN